MSDDVEEPPSKCATEPRRATTLLEKMFESAIVSPEKMVEKFKNAPSAPIRRLPGIPRSNFFPDLKELATGKTTRPSRQRQSSLPTRLEVEGPVEEPVEVPRTKKKVSVPIRQDRQDGYDF